MVTPLEQRAGMSQNEHFAVKAGMKFCLARTSENFILAFSIPWTISAFFCPRSYPTPPTPAHNLPALLRDRVINRHLEERATDGRP
jgi:hypothetical protein